MKKRALSLFLAVVFCLGLLPAGALAENDGDDAQTGGTTVLSADDSVPDDALEPQSEGDEPDSEPCSHVRYDWTYTENDDDTHTVRCSGCGDEWNEKCFDEDESTLTGILSNGEAGHTLQCTCGREKTVAHIYEPLTYGPQVTLDGKGHSGNMCVCGYTESKEAHTYDEDGECEECKFKPVFEDSEGNLYNFGGSNTTDAINEAVENGITSFKLVNCAQGENADTTTADAVFSLDTNAAVTLDMNGKTLTHGTGVPTLIVSAGTLTVQGTAAIEQTGQSQDTIKPAVKVTGGELIFEDAVTAIGGGSRSAAAPAIEVSGGKVTFEKNVTATGGLQGVTDNKMDCKPAIYATNGKLDFQGDLDLNGGLTITGGAALTNKLSKGTFRVEYTKEDGTAESVTGYRVSVVGSSNYTYVRDLLADNRVFANLDKSDSKNKYFNSVFEFLGWNVTIEEHEHTYVNDGNYHSCECGITENHTYDSSGECSVCHKPCPHEMADQSTADHHYYCNTCKKQMFARIQTDTYKWAHYTNLVDAMNAVEDGQTIKLLDDINNDGQTAAVTGNNKTVTLDLNGHTINEGWIYVGIDGENHSDVTSSTLKIIGYGNYILSGIPGLIDVGCYATLDLSGWTGGTITRIGMAKNGTIQPNPESTLIVGENIGYIGTLAFYNWPSSGIKSKLNGGTYGEIWITTNLNEGEPYSGMLAPGYAFQYTDSGEFVNYAKRAEYTGVNMINNVKIVKCTAHTDTDKDDLCDYCNTDLTSGMAASVTVNGKTHYYTTLVDAVQAADDGAVITLQNDVTLAENENIALQKNITFDLNGKNITGDTDGPVIQVGAVVTIRDSGNGGSIINTHTGDGYTVTMKRGSSLTIEGGIFGQQSGNIPALLVDGEGTSAAIKGGTFNNQVAVVNSGSLTISGGTFTLLFNGNSNGSIGDLLADGYAFRNSDAWLTENELTISTAANVTAVEAPITRIEWDVHPGNKFEYGYSGGTFPQLLAIVSPDDAGVSYKWYKDGAPIEGRYNVYTITDIAELPVGKHTYRVEVTTHDGYTKSAEIPVTITKIDLAKANITFDYSNVAVFWPKNGNNSIGDTYAPPYTVTLDGKTLTENVDYEVVQNHTTGVGPQTLKIKAKEGTNYTGTKTAEWIINPAELETIGIYGSGSPDAPKKAYDGTVALPNGFIASFDAPELWCDSVTLTEGTDYTLDKAEYVTADVGEYKPVNITITLKNPNYVFDKTVADGTTITVSEDGKTMTYSNWTPTNRNVNFTITPLNMPDFTKATAFSGVVNDMAAEYDIDLPELPALDNGKSYGKVTYTVGDVNLKNGYENAETSIVTVDGKPKLHLKVLAVQYDKEDAIGTVEVNVTTTNYKPVTLTVNLAAKNKYPPTVTAAVDPSTITYGTKLTDVKLSAEAVYGEEPVAGTIAWDEDTTALLNAGSHELKWKFTPTDTDKYREVTGTVTLTVGKATPTGEPKYTAITSSGKPLADAALAVNESWPAGTVKWVDKDGKALADTTEVKANTAYTWKFTPTDTVNYSELTGSITLYRVSSSGGGGGSSAPTYKPSVAPSENGTTTVSNPSPKKGDTVTVTPKPADGNTVSKVIVTDKNGKTIAVKANADGTYSFVQPDSAVTIEVVYQPKQTAQTDFSDVSAEHFAYDAVKWAAENGITGGIGDNLFAPSQSCTRAQIVTFLWRAAGSPEPKSLSGLTDVPPEAYYAKAVAWAVENGITAGMGDGRFAPDAACTRAQSVTFLARALNAKADGNADFTDVPADSYYASAVAWAVENGVTNGMGDNRFAPDRHCTRAQIVMFLYRAYNGK